MPSAECLELIEQACVDLDLVGLNWSTFGKRLRGSWRATTVPLTDLRSAPDEHGVRLGFRLPAGSYATVLLRRLLEGQWVFPYSQ